MSGRQSRKSNASSISGIIILWWVFYRKNRAFPRSLIFCFHDASLMAPFPRFCPLSAVSCSLARVREAAFVRADDDCEKWTRAPDAEQSLKRLSFRDLIAASSPQMTTLGGPVSCEKRRKWRPKGDVEGALQGLHKAVQWEVKQLLAIGMLSTWDVALVRPAWPKPIISKFVTEACTAICKDCFRRWNVRFAFQLSVTTWIS